MRLKISYMNHIVICSASLGLTREITTVIATRVWASACRMPHDLDFKVPDLVKIRCCMTAWSHLIRQLIDFVWAPWGLPASSRSCSTCFGGGSIWWFSQRLDLSSRLSPLLRLLPERAAELCPASSAAPPTAPAQFSGPEHSVFWSGTWF